MYSANIRVTHIATISNTPIFSSPNHLFTNYCDSTQAETESAVDAAVAAQFPEEQAARDAEEDANDPDYECDLSTDESFVEESVQNLSPVPSLITISSLMSDTASMSSLSPIPSLITIETSSAELLEVEDWGTLLSQ